MFSKVFGYYKLVDKKTYKFFFKNKLGKRSGKDIFKSIDDYWFSKKRLDELLDKKEIKNTLSSLIYIANKI